MPFIDPLFEFLRERYHATSGLFFDRPHGLRRRFASFATQTYLTLACYLYGEFTGKPHAIAMADDSTRKLIALQGPQGEWPWFFDALRGTVLDHYEIYSVHQYGMAPAFLEHAERHGVREAREALIRGFEWVLGETSCGGNAGAGAQRLSAPRSAKANCTRRRCACCGHSATRTCTAHRDWRILQNSTSAWNVAVTNSVGFTGRSAAAPTWSG